MTTTSNQPSVLNDESVENIHERMLVSMKVSEETFLVRWIVTWKCT